MNYWFELKYTLRLLRKKLGFTSLCVFIIAVGIGITVPLIYTAQFMGFAELPHRDADRFVTTQQVLQGRQNSTLVDPFVFRRLQQNVNSYKTFGAFDQFQAILSDGDTAERFSAVTITPDIFNMTEVAPLLGRSLQPDDDSPGARPVVVVSFDVWQNYYAGVDDIIGQQSRINGQPYTIAGVMPEGYGFPIAHDLWIPLQLDSNPEPGGARSLNVVGLLEEAATRDSASTEINSIWLQLSEEFPEYYGGIVSNVVPYTLILIADGPFFGQLMIGITITVLLLVCFNVGNLLTARNSERVAELAVRASVGGTRWRIIRQVLMESFLICLFAAIVGLALGALALNVLASEITQSPATLPYWLHLELQLNEVMVILAITFSVWLLSGLYPAWQISRQDISSVLNSESVAGSGAGRLTRTLVTLEIITSCCLLIICVSIVVGFYRSNNRDMGVESEGLLAARMNLSSGVYSSADDRLRFLNELRNEVLLATEFQAVTFASALAGQGSRRFTYGLEERDVTTDGRYPDAGIVWVEENYREQMQISLLEGRFFDFSDNANSLPVVIIDELFAERFWPNESALGKQIQLIPAEGGQWLTVVGVINHIIQGQPTAERLYQSTLYRPLQQLPIADPEVQSSVTTFSMAVQTPDLQSRPLNEYELLIKTAASKVDRDIPITNVMPLSRAMYLSMEFVNFFGDIMLWIASVTLLLAIAGIYGVVSRSVLSRGKEVGVRRALGSSNLGIINIFLRQGLFYALVGLLIGGANGAVVLDLYLGFVGSRDSSLDSLSTVGMPIALCLGLLVLIASYIPARKLIACEPGEVLHYE